MSFKQIDERLWVNTYSVRLFILTFVSRTYIYKLNDGSLWVWSPGSLSEELRKQIESIGRVKWVVAPNSFHHLFLSAYKRAFPEAKFYGVQGLDKKRSDFKFDGIIRPAESQPWEDEIETAVLLGSRFYNEAVFYLKAAEALVVTDLIFNLKKAKSWFHNLIWNLYGTLEKPCSSPICKRLVWNKENAKSVYDKIMSWQFSKMLCAHGVPLESEARAYVEKALVWMKK